MNTSPIMRLTKSDFIKGAVTAIIAGAVVAVTTAIHGAFTTPGFDIFSADWAGLFHTIVNTAIIGAEGAFTGYIGKALLTDKNGAVFGRWGGTE